MRYWSGVITGLVVSALALLVGLTNWALPYLVDGLPQLSADDAPRATAMVTGAAWAVLAPATIAVLLLAASILPRRRDTVRFVSLILVAIAASAVIAFTILGVAVALAEVSVELGTS